MTSGVTYFGRITGSSEAPGGRAKAPLTDASQGRSRLVPATPPIFIKRLRVIILVSSWSSLLYSLFWVATKPRVCRCRYQLRLEQDHRCFPLLAKNLAKFAQSRAGLGPSGRLFTEPEWFAGFWVEGDNNFFLECERSSKVSWSEGRRRQNRLEPQQVASHKLVAALEERLDRNVGFYEK